MTLKELPSGIVFGEPQPTRRAGIAVIGTHSKAIKMFNGAAQQVWGW
ncbi:hypothetical protein HMPREF1615_03835 [Escherichia coli 908632]|nr:hypothetical protein HMPREF1615_03835 [Escherichia coli 908632]